MFLKRGNGQQGYANVSYSTVDDTATAGVDSSAVSGHLQWMDGEQGFKSVSIPLLTPPGERNEVAFTVELLSVNGASLEAGGGVATVVLPFIPSNSAATAQASLSVAILLTTAALFSLFA